MEHSTKLMSLDKTVTTSLATGIDTQHRYDFYFLSGGAIFVIYQ